MSTTAAGRPLSGYINLPIPMMARLRFEGSRNSDGVASIQISVAIALGANAPYHLRENLFAVVAAAIASFLIAVSVYLCYGFSDRLELMIGPNGMNVIVRLTSFLLVCIGVQILWNGISALLLSLPNRGNLF